MKKVRLKRRHLLALKTQRARAKQLRCARQRRHAQRYGHRVGARPRGRTVVFRVPRSLTAERDSTRSQVLRMLYNLGMALQASSSRAKLDFSDVHYIYPGGMLILLAYVELLLALYPNRIRASCPPGSRAAQLLHQFGLASRLGVGARSNHPRDRSVTIWRYATGQKAEGSKLFQNLQSVMQAAGSSIPPGLYDAVTEAMTNVVHHAYPPQADLPALVQRWWLFSSCQPPTTHEPGGIYLAFYDVGLGIPTTMRNRLSGVVEHAREALARLLMKFNIPVAGRQQDSSLLKFAVDHDRSQTGLPFRGKGLPEIKAFAASTPGGRLTIVSGWGQYSYDQRGGASTQSTSTQEVPGTLILWSLPLHRKEPQR